MCDDFGDANFVSDDDLPYPFEGSSSSKKEEYSHKSPERKQEVLYVANLSFNVSEKDLENIFVEKGFSLNGVKIAKRHNGCSKGFGWVALYENGKSVVNAMSGIILDGRVVSVSMSMIDDIRFEKPKEEQQRKTFVLAEKILDSGLKEHTVSNANDNSQLFRYTFSRFK